MRALAMATTLATLLAAACSDGPTDPKQETSIAGTYVLQSVAGQALPYTVPGEVTSDLVAVTAGSITLTDGGSFSMSETLRFTSAGSSAELTMTATGTYTRAGSTLTFTVTDVEEGPNTFVATISDRTLTVSEEGEAWVFRR